MTTDDYLTAWTDITRLYLEGRFREGLDRLDEIAERFPRRRASVSHARACLHGRLGEADRVLAVMRDAVEQRVWWSQQRVADGDLDEARKDSDFAPLAKAMARLRQEALDRAPKRPEVMVRTPDADPARVLLVALHMYGATPDETLTLWEPATAGGVLVAAPRSTEDDPDANPCWEDDELTERDVRIAVQDTARRHSLDGGPVVLGGASQGARHAMRLALEGRIPECRGFIGVVGAADGHALAPALDGAAARGVRGWMIAGEADVLVRRAQESLYAELVRHGLAIELEIVSGLDHRYPSDFAARLDRALDFILLG